MVKSTKPERLQKMADWPPYWFYRWWKGLTEGDLRMSAEAQDHLERLGCDVKPRQPNQEVSA